MKVKNLFEEKKFKLHFLTYDQKDFSPKERKWKEKVEMVFANTEEDAIQKIKMKLEKKNLYMSDMSIQEIK